MGLGLRLPFGRPLPPFSHASVSQLRCLLPLQPNPGLKSVGSIICNPAYLSHPHWTVPMPRENTLVVREKLQKDASEALRLGSSIPSPGVWNQLHLFLHFDQKNHKLFERSESQNISRENFLSRSLSKNEVDEEMLRRIIWRLDCL